MTKRDKLLVALLLLWYAVTLFWYRAGLDWTGHKLSATLGLLTFLAAFAPVRLRRGKDEEKVEGRRMKDEETGGGGQETVDASALSALSAFQIFRFSAFPAKRLLRFPLPTSGLSA